MTITTQMTVCSISKMKTQENGEPSYLVYLIGDYSDAPFRFFCSEKIAKKLVPMTIQTVTFQVNELENRYFISKKLLDISEEID